MSEYQCPMCRTGYGGDKPWPCPSCGYGETELSAQIYPAIDGSKLTEHDWLQVEMAARGCTSGRLHEWPHLLAAFKRAGLEAHPSTSSCAVRDISRLLLMLSENHE